VKIGDLHREILAEIEMHVDDAKGLQKNRTKNVLVKKTRKAGGDTWILQSIRRRKAREIIGL
jgi:hypothetical protein